MFQGLGDGGIERLLLCASGAVAEALRAQQQTWVRVCVGLQRPDPDARARSLPFYRGCEVGHAGKRRGAILPSVVDDRERLRTASRNQANCDVGHVEKHLPAVVAVGVIPVVDAPEGTFRGARERTHAAAEGAQSGHGFFAIVALAGNDGGDMQGALPQLDSVAAVADAHPERDAFGIDLPEAQGAGARFHAVPVEGVAVVGGEIPGHGALGFHGAPAQGSIAALPVVAETEQTFVDARAPAGVEVGERKIGREEVGFEGGVALDEFEGHVLCGEARA